MKQVISYTKFILLFLLLVTASCTSFEEVNTNPNTTSQANAALLSTKVILSITAFNGIDGKVMISANALPKYIGYANEGQLDAQYNKIGSMSFGGMTVLSDIERMQEYAVGNVAEEAYNGLAHFARAKLFYELSMQVGDIPYSETNRGAEALYKPAYDTQLEVFTGILNELQLAADAFDGAYTFQGDPTPYRGDPDKWRRAVNAYTLKVLMSMSEKVDVPELDIVSRFNEIVGSDALMEAETGFYGLEYTEQDRHPLSGTNPIFTSKTIISSLLIDELKKLDDRRMYYFADPAVAQLTLGLNEDDPDAYVGVDVSMDYSEMNAGHNDNLYSLLNIRYLEDASSEPRRLMTFAEQQFIIAEAVILGWIEGKDSQDYYEEGVIAALKLFENLNHAYAHGMEIDEAYINTYLSGEAAYKASDQERLEQIWMQRYILNFMQDPRSAFFEYRRTGFPVFPINPATSLNEYNRDQLPLRWLYPPSETTLNRDNLVEALDRQFDGFDEINKRMWLLQ